MNKWLPALALIFFLPAGIAVAEVLQVQVRYSESPGLVRLVFDGMNDQSVKETKYFHSYSLIKIEFPVDVAVTAPKLPSHVELSQKGRSLFFNIAGLKAIKVFQLTGPPRFVIDAEVEKTAAKETRPEQPDKGEQQPEQTKLAGRSIIIDPGHGGYDMGMAGSEYREKDIALSIAQALRSLGGKSGASVVLTRSIDKYASIDERITEIQDKRPELFVSVHLSSSPDFVVCAPRMDAVSEAEAQYDLKFRQFRHLRSSAALAASVAEALRERFKRSVRIRQMPLPLLSAIDAPAVLVELPDGRFFQYSDSDRAAIAAALFKGITEHEKK